MLVIRKKILSHIFTYCQKQKSLTKQEQYGFECLVILLKKTIILFCVAVITNLLQPLIYLLFFFIPLKAFSFGKHLPNSLMCTIFSVFLFISAASIAKTTWHPLYLYIFFSAAYYIIITPKHYNSRPIKNNYHQPILVLILLIYSVLIIKQFYLSNFIIVATMLQAFLLTNIIFPRKEEL